MALARLARERQSGRVRRGLLQPVLRPARRGQRPRTPLDPSASHIAPNAQISTLNRCNGRCESQPERGCNAGFPRYQWQSEDGQRLPGYRFPQPPQPPAASARRTACRDGSGCCAGSALGRAIGRHGYWTRLTLRLTPSASGQPVESQRRCSGRKPPRLCPPR